VKIDEDIGIMTMDKRGKNKSLRAQGLAEFALILPVILLTLFVLVELARVLHAWLAVENGARTGVRYAVTAEYDPAYCPSGSTDGKCNVESEEAIARVQSIHDAAWAGSSSIVRVEEGEVGPAEASYFKVLVCDPDDLVLPGSTFDTHDCPPVENPGGPGDQVIVVVEFNHPLLTPFLNSVWPELRLTARREATVETYRIPPAVGEVPAFITPTPRPTNTPKPSPTASVTPTATSGTNPVEICPVTWNPPYENLHRHSVSGSGSTFGYAVHALPLSLPDTPVILSSADITTSAGDTLRVMSLTWYHPGMGTRTISINERSRSVHVELSESFYACGLTNPRLCVDDATGPKYGGILDVNFDAPLDGKYTLTIEVYFPEYGETCTLSGSYDTRPPEPTETFTAGPSPTRGPSRTPTRTPREATNTPVSPPTKTPTPFITPTNPGD
jgi:hypothetical protein